MIQKQAEAKNEEQRAVEDEKKKVVVDPFIQHRMFQVLNR